MYGSKVFEKGVFYSAIPVAAEPHAFAAQTTEQHRKARRHLAAAVSRMLMLWHVGPSIAVDGVLSAGFSDYHAVYPKSCGRI